MKGFFKSTTTLVLIIVFLVACILSMLLIFAASWLHTYKSFTREKTVAEIRISEQKEDELGKYVEVELTPIVNDQSALSRIFIGEEDPNPTKLSTETYKLYGDLVEIGGPIIKFKNGLILVNFETAYKLNILDVEYENDDVAEENRTSEMIDRVRIGENDNTYRQIADAIREDSITGKIYKIFFDGEPQRKQTAIYVTDKPVEGVIVIRNDGFHWIAKELDDTAE